MVTKRYIALRESTKRALDNDEGWRAARYTHEAAESLMRHLRLGKIEALERWSKDLNRRRFSPTSARRYYDLWEKYGEKRLYDHRGRELSFGEHYAAVRGGQRALEVMDEARRAGIGVHAAVGKPLSDTETTMERVHRITGRVRTDLETLVWLAERSEFTNGEEEFLLEFVNEAHKAAARVKAKLR